MKRLLFISFAFIGIIGFAQQQVQQTRPLFLSVGNNGYFNNVYAKLDAITNSITNTNFNIKRIDEIRQGQLIISTENIGKSLQNIKIDVQPSLDVELQRVMFSSNFPNPRQRFLVIKQ